MTEFVFKLPDLGEGTVEAEIVEWHVKAGDEVKEGDVIVDVMTDKANVEVPAPVDGKVLRTSGQPGDVVAVGSELIALEASGKAARRAARPEVNAPAADTVGAVSRPRTTQADAPAEDRQEPAPAPKPAHPAEPAEREAPADARPVEAPFGTDTARPEAMRPPAAPEQVTPAQAGRQDRPTDLAAPAPAGGRVITSPAIRRRAKEAGIDLGRVPGTGPKGRILRRDFEAALAGGPAAAEPPPRQTAPAPGDEFDESRVIGVRRVIAERMSQSKREIPHFAYVEEVDVTELEALRRHLGETSGERLTVLPFIAVGLIRALVDFPQCNARYDAERGMLQRYRVVHLGIATQTPDGLKVPVVRNAETANLWQLAREIARVAEAAREGKAGRNELSGSTITITSLGRMGGVVTTPVINYPEVGIIGVNKVADRPVVLDGQVRVRTMMNLSSSFDHRFVDGFDAAAMIQKLKSLLEHPATLFLDLPP